MIYLIILVLLIIFFIFPVIRCIVLNPAFSFLGSIRDYISYVYHKEGNRVKTGELVAYVGLFGKGKTLSAVHQVCQMYKKGNDKTVWCPRRKKFVTQKINILSNVSLSVPYQEFKSLDQIIWVANNINDIDDQNDTLTVTLVLGDEFSVQMNSRQFKTNIDPLLLNTILTCRHYNISIFYTTQRFAHVDALLRQVTSYVIECDKIWRFQRLNYFDAWELENATSTRLVKPIKRKCWFVRNEDYQAYDTLACVGNLQRSWKDGDMLPEDQIIANLQATSQANLDNVLTPSKTLTRHRKKLNK